MSDDPYRILGVTRDADPSEIKSAYRELALEHHPDHNPDDESSAEAFKEIAWAYQILSDPAKRRRYDRGGLDGLRGTAGRTDFSLRRGLEAFREFLEIFGSMFGGGKTGSRRPMPGDDLRASVTLDHEDVLRGTTVEIEVPSVRICPSCGGDGAADRASVDQCTRCGGRGQTRSSLMSLLQVCERCGGTGTIPSEACDACGGTGREAHRRTATIEVPAGIRDGQKLRRAGEGEPGRFGGSDGDLLVEVSVESPPEFERQGSDVRTEIGIPFTKASLGGRVRVPTIEGDVRMEIPAGTSSGDRFRLGGKGYPKLDAAGRGDQIVTVHVETPVELTERQRERVRGREDPTVESGSPSLGERIRRIIKGMD